MVLSVTFSPCQTYAHSLGVSSPLTHSRPIVCMEGEPALSHTTDTAYHIYTSAPSTVICLVWLHNALQHVIITATLFSWWLPQRRPVIDFHHLFKLKGPWSVTLQVIASLQHCRFLRNALLSPLITIQYCVLPVSFYFLIAYACAHTYPELLSLNQGYLDFICLLWWGLHMCFSQSNTAVSQNQSLNLLQC